MKFVVVNGRTPRQQTRCALCCEPIGKSYLRKLTTQLSYCDHRCYVGHRELPPQRSKSMRWRHDIHRRFEVPAANGSRPIVGGRLRGDKVSELFRTGEWIRRRSNCRREMFDRLLLFGWLLPQRDPIEAPCEGVMRRPQVCKHRVCDHCGGRFGMVTHRWWGNKFCKRTCKNADLRENHHTLSGWVIPRFFAFAGGARPAWTGHSAAGR
jgi:hypothetical protein